MQVVKKQRCNRADTSLNCSNNGIGIIMKVDKAGEAFLLEMLVIAVAVVKNLCEDVRGSRETKSHYCVSADVIIN
ncbi:MAG: hypothetical protein EZS28_000562 [Streblomastix strix]|uniref:Uncharacterized protein n=1 Tax=Streblomastix strix TaxID=222440 RepID=A0A5J4XAS6_9EUKA|nr:MAG: hypothetical protein EZS28_000562 [Streblomastix strix]